VLLGIPLGGFGFHAPGSHGLWPTFPRRYALPLPPTLRSRYPEETSLPGLGSSAFARHYLRNHSRFLFLGLLRCFTSPRLACLDYSFIQTYPPIKGDGLSHSEIHGSAPACGSPRLIATCYVLHRLLAPRHPPFALSSLITKFLPPAVPREQETQRTVFALVSIFFPMCSCQRTLPISLTSSQGFSPRKPESSDSIHLCSRRVSLPQAQPLPALAASG
jgi:hypothetical protein